MCCGSASVSPTRQPSAHHPEQLPRRRLPAPSWAAHPGLLRTHPACGRSWREATGPQNHPASGRPHWPQCGTYTGHRGCPTWGNSSTGSLFPIPDLSPCYFGDVFHGVPGRLSAPVLHCDGYRRPQHCLLSFLPPVQAKSRRGWAWITAGWAPVQPWPPPVLVCSGKEAGTHRELRKTAQRAHEPRHPPEPQYVEAAPALTVFQALVHALGKR